MTSDPAVPARPVSWRAGADFGVDRVVRIWAQVARQSRGAPVSVAHVCAAAADAVGVDVDGSETL